MTESYNLKSELYKKISEQTSFDSVTINGRSITTVDTILNSKDRVLELADSLRETVRDKVGVFLFIKNKTSNKISAITNDFWLTSMQFSYKERVQVMEAFASSNFAFFGDNVKLYNFTAITIDATSSDPFDPGKHYYQTSILKLYDEKLRGTKLIEKDDIAVLVAANHIIEGYPLNLTVAYAADTEPMTQFSFNFIAVKHYYDLDGIINNARLEKMYSTESRKISVANQGKLKELNKRILKVKKQYIIKKKIILNYFPKLKKLPDEIELNNLVAYLPNQLTGNDNVNLKRLFNEIKENIKKELGNLSDTVFSPTDFTSLATALDEIVKTLLGNLPDTVFSPTDFTSLATALDEIVKTLLDEIMKVYLENSKKLYNIEN